MSELDIILSDSASEFREAVDHIPPRSWNEPVSRRGRLGGLSTAVVAAIGVLVLFSPVALFLMDSPRMPALQSPADVVFEGDGWILGLREEARGDDADFDFCWEFEAIGRGPDGVDVTDAGCDERSIPEEGGSGHFGGIVFELSDITLMVAEFRPGDGGQVEVRTGRQVDLYEPKRMPLSGADVYVLEIDPDASHQNIRHVAPWWKNR